MRVVTAYPPNIEEIAAVLPEAKSGRTIFCYGDIIYNPNGAKVGFALRAHEAVHSARQGKTDESIRSWWSKYIADPQFRLDEELPAHQAEFAAFCELERDNAKRFRFLVELAIRLSGPLYGQLIDFAAAKQRIKEQR